MNPSLNLSISRIFKCDAKTLFQAIGEGMLFKFTGAVKETMKIDFREGGKFHLDWKGHGDLDGVFQTIVPFTKIVFSWPTMGKELNQRINTLVTVSIKESFGKSILTLKHEGFDGFLTLNEHDFGWDDALADLHKWMRGVFAELEKNATGLDLYFKIKKTVSAPRAKVYGAVADHRQLNQYFAANAVGDFTTGTKVEWNFKNYPKAILDVSEAIGGELITFKWGDTTVCFSFRDKSADQTEIVVSATGWPATQKGLEDSYKECEGWQNFLDQLAGHLQD